MIRDLIAAAAQHPADLDMLSQAWQVAWIRVTCPSAATLANRDEIGGRVRGALGQQLKHGASRAARNQDPCDWATPCALDILFASQGNITAGLEVPKPWALSLRTDGADLSIRIALFGMAASWAGEVADALVRGLRAGLTQGERRVPLEVSDREITMQSGARVHLPGDRPLMLDFISPLSMRSGGQSHAKPASLIKTLANRISGLAAWHGMRLEIDANVLKAQADRIGALATWEDGCETGSIRAHSSRHPNVKRLQGFHGRLLLPAPGALIVRLIELGADAQAGGRTTHGFGAYDVSVLPPL